MIFISRKSLSGVVFPRRGEPAFQSAFQQLSEGVEDFGWKLPSFSVMPQALPCVSLERDCGALSNSSSSRRIQAFELCDSAATGRHTNDSEVLARLLLPAFGEQRCGLRSRLAV